MTRLIIAETGVAPGELPDRFGCYGQMMQAMLKPLSPQIEVETIAVYASPFLPLPAPRLGDALLITGSPAGVYEDHVWIPPLEHAVRAYKAVGAKVVGICFGHQLMAQALGGRVEKSPKGWGVGVHTYGAVLDAQLPSNAPTRFSCAVSHQDQVVALPPGANCLAGSEFCPNGVIAYADGNGLSFQMHPEFSHEFGQSLLRSRQDLIPVEVYEQGLASYAAMTDRLYLARWISQFLFGGRA